MATHRRLIEKEGPDLNKNIVNMTGMRFGKLTVLGYTKDRRRAAYWKCVCICGKEVIVNGYKLRSGHTKSCGCLLHKHGATRNGEKHPLYDVWRNMRRRCNDPKNDAYPDYGGRGICVCEQWNSEYTAFRDYMLSLPNCPKEIQKPGGEINREIDRIDNDGNYEPGNVRWGTYADQTNNRRSNIIILLRGNRLSLKQYAEKTGVPYYTFQNRLRRGQTLESLLKEFSYKVFRFSRAYYGNA